VVIVNDALNGVWRINIGGQVYGPYTGYQIRAFAKEGRVAPHSIVQADERGPWITAIDDPILAQLFVDKPSQPGPEIPKATAARAPVASQPAFGNFVVVIDVGPQTLPSFEGAMPKLGEVHRLNTHVWLVHTELSAHAIRSEVARHLGPNDTLFIVDATRDKTAWLNLGPTAEAKIRALWKTGTERYDA
jgi:hypothetical protein